MNTFLRSKCVINISLMNSFYASIFRNCSISGQWLSHPESNLPRRTKIQICINDVFMKQTTLKHYVLRILIIFCSVHCSEYRSLPIFNYYLLKCVWLKGNVYRCTTVRLISAKSMKTCVLDQNSMYNKISRKTPISYIDTIL